MFNNKMKYLTIILLALLLYSCGSSKKVISSKETPDTILTIKEAVEREVKDSVMTVKPSATVKEVTKKIEVIEEADSEETVEVIPHTPEIFNHSAWDALLREFVSNDGKVNYEGFRGNKGHLRVYIASLGANLPSDIWTREDKLAYWMNAYNAMTIDLILRNLPLESIKDIDKPWHQRHWKLGAKWYNLDEIEHQILRKMEDPRIHFGINCASFSCPPLLNEAFTSNTVDSQLELLAHSFVNDPRRNTISKSSIQVSKLFSWFAKDFKTRGTLIDFLNRYSEITIDPKARKSFKTYDWSLNK